MWLLASSSRVARALLHSLLSALSEARLSDAALVVWAVQPDMKIAAIMGQMWWVFVMIFDQAGNVIGKWALPKAVG
ncbi:hypothetical protein HUA78_37985 [Myxococcus sp. CA033]|nr:hypothetical protein [Myxococcus sp. CA033]